MTDDRATLPLDDDAFVEAVEHRPLRIPGGIADPQLPPAQAQGHHQGDRQPGACRGTARKQAER